MIHFITGEIDSGKSTRFLSMYKDQKGQIGLYSKKLYDDQNTIIGYNLVLLPEYKEIPFVRLKDSLSDYSESESYFRGRFVFSKVSFKIGESYILNNFNGNTVWIDEIGGLELKGLGFDSLIKTLLTKNIDIVLVVRNSLFLSVLNKYNIKDYIII